MGVPGDLYRPTPQGYNGNPAGRGSQPSVSVFAGFSADRWGPPIGGSRRLLASWPTNRPHRLGVLSGAGYCCLASDDEGFVEVSMATVSPPWRALTVALPRLVSLMRHMFRGREVAGYWEPATPLAD